MEGHWTIADVVVEKRTKARGQDAPKEQWRQTEPPQWHTTLKGGCKAWRKMLLRWRWEMVMWLIMGLSRDMLVLSIWVEAEDCIEDKAPHDYQETLPVDVPLSGEWVLIDEVIRLPISHLWLEGLEKVTEQGGQEEVWGWRSICWSSRMKRPKILWLTIHGGGM